MNVIAKRRLSVDVCHEVVSDLLFPSLIGLPR